MFYLTIWLNIKTILNIWVDEPFSKYLDVVHSTFFNDRQGLQGYNNTVLSKRPEVLWTSRWVAIEYKASWVINTTWRRPLNEIGTLQKLIDLDELVKYVLLPLSLR